jgi:hypothetical protein
MYQTNEFATRVAAEIRDGIPSLTDSWLAELATASTRAGRPMAPPQLTPHLPALIDRVAASLEETGVSTPRLVAEFHDPRRALRELEVFDDVMVRTLRRAIIQHAGPATAEEIRAAIRRYTDCLGQLHLEVLAHYLAERGSLVDRDRLSRAEIDLLSTDLGELLLRVVATRSPPSASDEYN